MIKKTIMSLVLISSCYLYGNEVQDDNEDPRDVECENLYESTFTKCFMNLAHFHRQEAYDFGKMYDDNRIDTASQINPPMPKEEFVFELNDIMSDYINDNETRQDYATREEAEKAFVGTIFKLTQCKRDKRAASNIKEEL